MEFKPGDIVVSINNQHYGYGLETPLPIGSALTVRQYAPYGINGFISKEYGSTIFVFTSFILLNNITKLEKLIYGF